MWYYCYHKGKTPPEGTEILSVQPYKDGWLIQVAFQAEG
jgi:hypothetical protein